MSTLTSTPPPFIERDPAALTAAMVADYEGLTGKPLYPAQVERILIDLIAYYLSLHKEQIQDAAQQNLVRWARAPMLDELGALIGCHRLAATPARVRLQITLRSSMPVITLVPAGSVFRVGSSEVLFNTDDDLEIPAGQRVGNVWATAQTVGSLGNGQPEGAACQSLSDLSESADIVALTATSGGGDEETDDHYRERIMLAPESFSVAGPREAYKYFAMSAHPDIVDVAIGEPSPGVVTVYPLTASGLPSASIIDLVYAELSDDKRRPLTDQVIVQSPEPVDYQIAAELTLYTDADTDTTLAAARASLDEYLVAMASILGRDIVPSQIIAALSVAGVYRVDLVEPSTAFVVEEHQWPRCSEAAVSFAGAVNG